MKTEVSIILPVYNASAFLSETISSICNQTYLDFELIAIDDGSTDRSSEILADFARRDSRIVFFRRENRGVGATSTECMARARNDLIVRHDADDLMLPNRLERQVWFMQQNQSISAATGYAWLTDRDGNIVAESKPIIDIERGIRELEPRWFVDLIQPATIMRKTDILAVGGYSKHRYAEDRELWGRLVASGYRVAVQPEFVIKQRIHGSSLTGRPNRHKLLHCAWIDHNTVRLLQGKECISFETFLENRRTISFPQRALRDSREVALMFYKEATREFADRRWWRFLKHCASAILLDPMLGYRMFQKVSFRRSLGRD
jgi:glycosyltransferase involved in cell wall biosynthesis